MISWKFAPAKKRKTSFYKYDLKKYHIIALAVVDFNVQLALSDNVSISYIAP